MAHISVDKKGIAAFCRKHHIRRLALFGSVLREDFTPDSDIDVLADFEPGYLPGLSVSLEWSGSCPPSLEVAGLICGPLRI
jgi:predicted nucleotidyltransferase